ncbi:hypothetical protein FIU87_07535 [Bacillus sp. THAF10]|uniref:DUF4183 domain-containing protein n=1 Tax=Bacillus sp. THAF10 TaxID=2587848 RepID=UPI0012691AD4|nr:DUF4183 domain-containing protein [Bacillus sp. THAF10]QFT88490.1 hypothetical protein FIU87_07535 [Bacillus sp. THAF10]
MALQLMKLHIVANSTVGVDPTITRFFYVTTADTTAGNTLSIDTGDFFDDTGAAATALPVLTTNNSYFNVYVNGVLQMEAVSTYTPGAPLTGSLDIAVPAGSDPILSNTPIVLEVANYSPSVNTTITT